LTFQKIKSDLLDRAGPVCISCGETFNPQVLEVARIVPGQLGGSAHQDNVTLICSTCHRLADSGAREGEWIRRLGALMKANPRFDNVRCGPEVSLPAAHWADITAAAATGDGEELLLIECRPYHALSSTLVQEVIDRLQEVALAGAAARMVLAFPGRASDEQRRELANAGIDVWDVDFLVAEFADEIARTDDSWVRATFDRARTRLGPHKVLIERLRRCLPGQVHWRRYQDLVRTIFVELFCPPLDDPFEEHSDSQGANRRDLIFPNHSQHEFWRYLRERYEADYIVVDPKNHREKIGKQELIGVANYLKPCGTGRFGIVVSRKGLNRSGEVTQRELWMLSPHKMLLVITDDDLQDMLRAWSTHGDPSAILRAKLGRLRLSI